MARARLIKPGFFTNDAIVELPAFTRLLFIGLWTLADREGRLEDRPKRIRMEIFPADDVDVDRALDDLAAAGFIQRYSADDGARYLQVANFLKHQNPHPREAKSAIPAPSGNAKVIPRTNLGGGEATPETPIPSFPSIPSVSGAVRARVAGETPVEEAEPATVAGKACLALKAAGVQRVNPSHAGLLQLLSVGVTAKQLGDLAAELHEKTGKPARFEYVLGTMTGRLEDAAAKSSAKPVNGRSLPYPAEFIGWERDDRKLVGLCRNLGYGDGPPGYTSDQLREYLRGKIGQRQQATA
jgi:hypothetical protein